MTSAALVDSAHLAIVDGFDVAGHSRQLAPREVPGAFGMVHGFDVDGQSFNWPLVEVLWSCTTGRGF